MAPKKKPVKKTIVTKKTAAVKKGKAKKPAYDLSELQGLAIEMNEQLGLDPAIDEDCDNAEELAEYIKMSSVDEDDEVVVYTSDEFSKAAWKTMKALGIKPVEPPVDDGEDQETEEAEETETEEAEETETEEAEEKPKPKAKAKAKPKAKPKPKAKAETKPEKKSEPKVKKSKRYTRASAFAEAIKAGVNSLGHLAENANEIYIENGGKDNIKEAKWMNNIALSLLEEFELISIKDEIITINF